MAKTYTAAFAQTPRTATAVVTGATTVADDAPANTAELLTAGAEGCIVTSLTAMPRATVTAASLVLFLSSDGGVTKRLIDSELMGAHTVAATTAIPETVFSRISESSPLRLAAGDKLYVGSQVALAGGIVFAAQYTDF